MTKENQAELRIALGVISGRIRSQDIDDDTLNSIGFMTWRHGVPPTELLREWAEQILFDYLTNPLIAIGTKGECHE